MKIKKLEISFKFAWYDIWVGLFIDRKKNIWYFCPLPTILFIFQKTS